MESAIHVTPDGMSIRVTANGIASPEAFTAATVHAVSVADQVLIGGTGAALNYDEHGVPSEDREDITVEIERTERLAPVPAVTPATTSTPCGSTERWPHADHYICIEGLAVRVGIDHSDDRGLDLQVNALCPECGDATDWTLETIAPDVWAVVDRSCGKRWDMRHGVPPVIPTAAPVTFARASVQSLHVEAIARLLFAAATAAAHVPDLVWDKVDARVRTRLRRRAELAVLDLNSGLAGLALLTVKAKFGPAGELALDLYDETLLAKAPIVGATAKNGSAA